MRKKLGGSSDSSYRDQGSSQFKKCKRKTLNEEIANRQRHINGQSELCRNPKIFTRVIIAIIYIMNIIAYRI